MKSFLLFAVALSLGAVAFAGPCDADVDKYCGDVQPGQGSIANCLQSQEANLSFQCRD